MPDPFIIPAKCTRIEIDRAVSRFRFMHAILSDSGRVEYIDRKIGTILGVVAERDRHNILLHDRERMWHLRIVQSARM